MNKEHHLSHNVSQAEAYLSINPFEFDEDFPEDTWISVSDETDLHLYTDVDTGYQAILVYAVANGNTQTSQWHMIRSSTGEYNHSN